MKNKQTIAEWLAKKDYKEPSNFAWALYSFLIHLPPMEPKYHVSYEVIDDPKDCKTGCFVIWNHQSRRDFYFIKKIFGKKKFNMVSGYNEHFRKKFHFLFNCSQVIPKKNFTQDYAGVKAMTKIIKNGGCIAFSPEGMSSIYGHNQPIVPGTGRFLQFFRVPVYFMKLEGAYLTSHKCSIKDRVGKINCKFYKLFDGEEIAKMSPEDIELKVNEACKHDDYEWNKTARIKFKTKHNAADRLDDLIYKCPKCGKEFTITAHGDTIKCDSCGFGVTIDDYYDMRPLIDGDKVPASPSEWFDDIRRDVYKDIRKDDKYSFSFKCKLGELPKYDFIKDGNRNSVDCGEGIVTINHDGFHFNGTKHGEPFSFSLGYDIIYSLVITSECNSFSMYYEGEFYEFMPSEKVVGKALLVTEEMHRLHVNYWKNFPWFDYNKK